MKKNIKLLLTGLIMLAMSSCTIYTDPEAEAVSASQPPIEVVVLHGKSYSYRDYYYYHYDGYWYYPDPRSHYGYYRYKRRFRPHRHDAVAGRPGRPPRLHHDGTRPSRPNTHQTNPNNRPQRPQGKPYNSRPTGPRRR